MPNHSRLDDPAFVEQLERALRIRRESHLSVTASAKIVGMPKSLLAVWESRLRNGQVTLSVELQHLVPPPAVRTGASPDVMRERVRASQRARKRRLEEAAARHPCLNLECPRCRRVRLVASDRSEWDVLAEMPRGGFVAVGHACR